MGLAGLVELAGLIGIGGVEWGSCGIMMKMRFRVNEFEFDFAYYFILFRECFISILAS